MGYRGKVVEQTRACELRAEGWTYDEICAELGVSKSSVSLWCRDVVVDPVRWDERRTARDMERRWAIRGPNALARARLEQIERLKEEGRARIGSLSEREFLVAGTMLYAGEGDKTGHEVGLPNTDPRLIAFHLAWLRHFFTIDESRLRVRLYLHDDLDVHAATEFWSELTDIPRGQFQAPYRPRARQTRTANRHLMGCPKVRYADVTVLRTILGWMDALLSCNLPIRGGAIGSAGHC